MKYYLSLYLCLICLAGFSQVPDSVYSPNIKTCQLFAYGNQLGYPILHLNSSDRLELHFDDLDADVKNYSYTYQLCNADWKTALISELDYIRGFSQIPINNYRYSSISLTRYTHYQGIVPDQNCVPTRSGNYLLKVFLDGDTSKLVFARRFLVVEDGVNIDAQLLQPFNPLLSLTHQKLQFSINTRSLSIANAAQQVSVIILQNNRWDNALHDIKPSFYSVSTLKYTSDDDYNFPAGKQWRWVDIQSFRFQSDRVHHVNYSKNSTEIFVMPDQDRSQKPYYYYNDYNGLYLIQTTENIDPLWQADYATVHFSFVPPGNIPFTDKDVYILGQLTNYALNDSTKMSFNAEKGIYEVAVFLKQGFYYYSYVTVNKNDPSRNATFEFTEGNNMETENDYSILVYYRQLGGRADQLVGIAKLNSLNGRQSN
jgi:Domain of unknown function (DUF5103)